VRHASDRPSRARRRGFAVVVTLVTAFGLLTACGDKETPAPAISGENPGDVTIPTLPPTTSAPPVPAEDDQGGDATDSSSPTTAPTSGGGGTDSGDTESDSADTVPPEG